MKKITIKNDVIERERPWFKAKDDFLIHMFKVAMLVMEDDTAPIQLKAITLDTFCSVEKELAARN